MYWSRWIFRTKISSVPRAFPQLQKPRFQTTMAELEERPSKIRKLDSTAKSSESPHSYPVEHEASEVSKSEAPNDLPSGMKEEPSEHGAVKSGEQPKLSKSALKKLRKAQQWEAGREDRKLKRREKDKEKKARKAELRAKLQAEIASGEPATLSEMAAPKQDGVRLRRPVQVPVSLILDCDFNHLMNPKELISLASQLTRCYSENRQTPYRSHLALSSFGGVLKSRFENVLSNNHLGWKSVKFYEEDFEFAAEELDEIMRSHHGGQLLGAFAKETGDATLAECSTHASAPVSEEGPKGTESIVLNVPNISQGANGTAAQDPRLSAPPTTISSSEEPRAGLDPEGKEVNPESIKSEYIKSEDMDSEARAPRALPSIVYLTSDSPHTLEYLEPNTSYIIGGIVDKNRHKGLCYKRACERGIPTAKLPIGEYMTMQSRTVLAINHVVEIMLKWIVTGDWGEAFLSVIPKRKEAKLKFKKGEENQGGKSNHTFEGDEEESDDEEEGGASLLIDKSMEAEQTAGGDDPVITKEHSTLADASSEMHQVAKLS